MSKNTHQKIIKDNENWFRLSTAQRGPVKQKLSDILHNKNNDKYQGLPEDPLQLYHELSTTHKPKIDVLKKKKVLNDDQIELLMPTNGDKKTFSEKFDVTLIVLLIINCTTLPPPVNGWFKSPLDSDTSAAANVLRARAWRNFLNHTDVIDQTEFETEWKKGISILTGLGGSANDMVPLKTASLDPNQEVVMNSLIDFNAKVLSQAIGNTAKIKDLDNQAIGNTTKINNFHNQAIGNTTKINNFHNQAIGNTTKINNVHKQAIGNTIKITDLDKRLDHQNKQAMADNEEREKQTEQKFQEMQQVQTQQTVVLHGKIDENTDAINNMKRLHQNKQTMVENSVLHKKVKTDLEQPKTQNEIRCKCAFSRFFLFLKLIFLVCLAKCRNVAMCQNKNKTIPV